MAAWLIPVGIAAGSAVAKPAIRYLAKWITSTGKTATKSVGSKEAGIKVLGKKGFKPSDIKVETGKGIRAKGAEAKKTAEKFRKHGSQVGGPEIIISGPGGPDNPKEMKTDLSNWGVSDQVISELRGDDLRKAHKAKRLEVKGRRGGGKVIYKAHGGMSRVGLSPAEEKHEGKSRSTGTLSEAKRKLYMNTGGKVGDKKQGYKARKDESIAQRVKKKRTPKQLAASRDESYGKWGKGKGKGKINHADGNKLVASLYD